MILVEITFLSWSKNWILLVVSYQSKKKERWLYIQRMLN